MPLKLSFFEKDNLDPTQREQLTISTPDLKKDNLQEINKENDLVYKSSSRLARHLRRVEMPLKWLPFVDGGVRACGKIKKINITSGEGQIIKSAFQNTRTQQIISSFRVAAKRVAAPADDLIDALTTAQSFEKFSIPAAVSTPEIEISIGSDFIHDFDFGNRLQNDLNNDDYDFVAFRKWLLGTYGFYSNSLAGSFSDHNEFTGLPVVLQSHAGSSLLRESTINSPDAEQTRSHQFSFKIFQSLNAFNQTYIYNFNVRAIFKRSFEVNRADALSFVGSDSLGVLFSERIVRQSVEVSFKGITSSGTTSITDTNLDSQIMNFTDNGGTLLRNAGGGYPGTQAALDQLSTQRKVAILAFFKLLKSQNGLSANPFSMYSPFIDQVENQIADRQANLQTAMEGTTGLPYSLPAFTTEAVTAAQIGLTDGDSISVNGVSATVVLGNLVQSVEHSSFPIERSQQYQNTLASMRVGYFRLSSTVLGILNKPFQNSESLNDFLEDSPIEISFQSETYRFTEYNETNGFKIVQVSQDDMGEEIEINPTNLQAITSVGVSINGAIPLIQKYQTIMRQVGEDVFFNGSASGPIASNSEYTLNFANNFVFPAGITVQQFRQRNIQTISKFRELSADQGKVLSIIPLEGVADEEDAEPQPPVDLLDSVPEDFPFISVNRLEHDDDNDYLNLYLSRKTQNAPVPSPRYFDQLTVGNRNFFFSNASYEAFDQDEADNPFPNYKIARYRWSSSDDPTEGLTNVPLIFKKSGQSIANEKTPLRLIQKSSVQTKEEKEFDIFINGFEIVDFEFSDSFFRVDIKGSVATSDILAVRILDKDGVVRITRDMFATAATRTEQSNSTTRFQWDNLDEFINLKRNKQYKLEIIRANETSTTVNKFFIPRPSQFDTFFPLSIDINANDIVFSFLPNTADKVLNIKSMGIKGPGSQTLMADTQISQAIINDFKFTFLQAGIDPGNSPADFMLSLTVEDFSHMIFDFLKLTDLFFDTVVLLDTNIDDLSLKDATGNELLHPSDILEIKSVEENNKRHVVMFLKNPVTTPNVELHIRQTNMNDPVISLSRILLLKKIGEFSKYPKIKPLITKTRTVVQSQAGKSHVITRVPARNFSITFPPLDNLLDVLLAEDLFNRSADFSEFIVWPSGGESTIKNKGLTGFAFKDLVKSLCGNDFEYMYVDGRFTSGIDFTMETLEVP